MPHKDPERRREYHREYQRLKRAGQTTRAVVKPAGKPLTPEQINTAQGLSHVLVSLIGEVISTDEGDIFMRARTAGYLISIGLKAMELVNFEGRLTKLEEKTLGGEK